jgi:hypothetical protein
MEIKYVAKLLSKNGKISKENLKHLLQLHVAGPTASLNLLTGVVR